MSNNWKRKWNPLKRELPYKQEPYSKKNWGNPNHSLCSYQGKLKPAIAHFLVRTFVPQKGRLLDPFCGVGTIPYEGALNKRTVFGIDISEMAYYISNAKVGFANESESNIYIEQLEEYINQNIIEDEIKKYSDFGFNKTLKEYYEPTTFKEILLAKRFFAINRPTNASEMVVISSLLHILHGNRPYALSRKSHPITPYAPSGEFIYKNLVEKLRDKVDKFYKQKQVKVEGKIFLGDSTQTWSEDISDLDAIITSPPFYDSTKFYLANWIRLWFCGWEPEDFNKKPNAFVDEIQKKDFAIYENIFRQGRERLKNDGVFVLHLGKSKKCNMGETLERIGRRFFNHSDIFNENVEDCNTFGITDLGSVTEHQYLVLW